MIGWALIYAHVYSPWAGTKLPLGTKVLSQKNFLFILPYTCKFEFDECSPFKSIRHQI